MDALDTCISDYYEDVFSMDSLYGEFAKRVGESYHALFVLSLLDEHPEGISQKQLCQELHTPKQTVGSIINSLEQRELVTHRPDEADKRSKLHSLTPEGALCCKKIIGTLRGIERRCAAEVGIEDMNRAHEISQRYASLFKQELDTMKDGQNQ